MMKAQKMTPTPGNMKVYNDQMQAMKRLREGGFDPKSGKWVAGFNEMAIATGRFGVETVKTVSATENLTTAIQKQKLTFSQALKQMGTFKAAWREQAALQKASAMQWTGSMTGKNKTDLYVPKNLNGDLDNFRTKYGYINQAIGSIAHQTVNWGKNTQWAGRQITVGIGVPLAMAAALMGKLAYEADQQLTRIAKVYDTTDFSKMGITDPTDQMIAANQELVQVRNRAMQDGVRMAKAYGAALKDTLALEADLAATGLKGNELRETTEQVTRIATLGELDHQTALDMTITLMSTMNEKAADLGNSFNFLNAIENATSLSTQDFATALPRMAGALTGVGVNVQEMGILMVALKEGGVNAAEGANALKSATTRLLRPTAAAQAAFSGMGIVIEDVVARNGGNLFKILNDLGGKMKEFPALQKQQAIAALFGTYQFNRLNVVMSNLADVTNGDLPEGFSQTAKAMEIAKQETSKWAAIADLELSQAANSISGKFKRAVEGVKADLATLGAPIMKVLTPVIEFIGRLIQKFQELPGIFKTILIGLATFGLVMGPLIMGIGLMGNLFGNFVKFMSNVANLGLRFKAMTAEQRATELMSRRAASAFDSEASSIALLTINMKKMIAVLEQQALAQQKAAMIASGMSPQKAAAATALRGPDGRFESQAKRAQRLAQETAQQSERARVSMMGVASAAMGLGLGVVAIKNMADGSGSMLDNFMNIALLIGAIQMSGLGTGILALFKVNWKSMGAKVGTFFKTAALHVRFIAMTMVGLMKMKWANMIAGLRTSGGLMTKLSMAGRALMGPAGWVVLGIGVLVAGLALAKSHMVDMTKLQKAVNDDAEKLAEIYGYTFKQGSVLGNDVDPDTQAGRRDTVTKLKEEVPELITLLDLASSSAEKFDIAMQEAIKVATSGGSSSQARLHFQSALQAAGMDEAEIDRLTVRYDAIDIGNPDSLKHQIQAEIDKSMKDIELPPIVARGRAGQQGVSGLEDAGKAAADKMAKMISSQVTAIGDDMTKMSDFFRQVGHSANELFSEDWDKWFNGIDEGFQKKIKAAGIDSIGELQAYMDDNPGVFEAEIDGLDTGSENLLKGMTSQYKDVVQSIIDQLVTDGYMSEKEGADLLANAYVNLGNVASGLGAHLLSLGDAQAGYNNEIMDATSKGKVLTEAQKLAILNTWRQKRGLDAATSSAQGFGPAILSAAEAAQELADALNFDPATSIITAEQSVSLMQDSFSNAQGYVLDRANKLADRADQARQDSIQRSGEGQQAALEARGKREDKFYDGRQKALEDAIDAENDAFKNAWDAKEKGLEDQIDRETEAYDARVKLIEDEIDALDAADNERQKLFERQKTRLSRMAEMANSSVDINAALNSGNLDEAAKLYNSSSATVAQWGMDDEDARLQEVSDAKKKALQGKIDAINAEKDARIKALEAQKDAMAALREYEEGEMRKRQEARQADLQAEKDAAKEKLDAAKESARLSTQAALDRDKRESDSRKDTLERQLNTIKASTPKTMEEYRNQIAQIEAAYKVYGVDLQKQGDAWTGIIGAGLQDGIATAAAALQNTIGWQQMGTYISDQVGKGTGLTMESIKTFLMTGKFPTGAPTAATPYVAQQSAARDAEMKKQGYTPLGGGRYRGPGGRIVSAYHDGGQIGEKEAGWSQKDRAGVPRSAGKYPSEYHALLKRGEFVVNARDARKNIALLRAINGGAGIPAGDPGLRGINAAQYFNGMSLRGKIDGIHHTGGLIDATAGTAAGFGNVLLSVTDMVAREAANQMLAGMSNSLGAIPYLGGTGGNVNTVLNTARREQGKPYIWGGAGPAGSDCSGFMSIVQNAVYGKNPPYGRRWATGSFAGGKEIDGWKRGGTSKDVFRIGVDPNSHTAGTFAGINVESGSGHGPMVGGRALGADSGFRYKYYLPAANNLPQLKNGGRVKYDNTLANLHRNETVLTAPLTKAFQENVASGFGNEYNVEVNFNGPVNSEIDVTKAVRKAIDEIENKNGRKRVIK